MFSLQLMSTDARAAKQNTVREDHYKEGHQRAKFSDTCRKLQLFKVGCMIVCNAPEFIKSCQV